MLGRGGGAGSLETNVLLPLVVLQLFYAQRRRMPLLLAPKSMRDSQRTSSVVATAATADTTHVQAPRAGSVAGVASATANPLTP